ncbi:MAG: hypothetical protein D6823_05715 [Chloroflexi bacterium]|nr:MAG: hypothetical protein D6823_05715 [Chloroflexota bacterium]
MRGLGIAAFNAKSAEGATIAHAKAAEEAKDATIAHAKAAEEAKDATIAHAKSAEGAKGAKDGFSLPTTWKRGAG